MKNMRMSGLSDVWQWCSITRGTNNSNANNDSSSFVGKDVSSYSSSDSVNVQHSVITSALWALARSPALVNAVEYEESRDGNTKQLSKILRDLGRDDVLNNAMKLKDAMGNAEAYLAASNMPRFGSMEVCMCLRASNKAEGNFLVLFVDVALRCMTGDDKYQYLLMRMRGSMVELESYPIAENITCIERYEPPEGFIKVILVTADAGGSLEPLAAMRAIIGMCADSKAVMDAATMSVYHEETWCTDRPCTFTGGERRTELELRCLSGCAQRQMDTLAHPTTNTICSVCSKKSLRKAWTMQVAPDCFVVTWPLLSNPEAIPKDILRVRRKRNQSSDLFTFKLGVMVARKTRYMCLFRNGNNFYMATGQEVKEVHSNDWRNAKPSMALYFHDLSGDSPVTNAPLRSRVGSVGNGRQGRALDLRRASSISPSPSRFGKRRHSETERDVGSRHGAREDGNVGDRGSHSWGCSRGGSSPSADAVRRAKPAAAMTSDEAQEVIEVDDDDEDDGDNFVVSHTTAPPSPADGSHAVEFDRRLDDYNRADGETTARYHGDGAARAGAARRGRDGESDGKDNDDDDRGLPRKTSLDTTAAHALVSGLGGLISARGAGANSHFDRMEQSKRLVVDAQKRTERSNTPALPSQIGATESDSGRSMYPPSDDMDVDEERADEKSVGDDIGNRRSILKGKGRPPSPPFLSSQHKLARDGGSARSSDRGGSVGGDSRDNNKREDAGTPASGSKLAAGERLEAHDNGDSQMRPHHAQQREREEPRSRGDDVTMIGNSGSEDDEVQLLASDQTRNGAAPADPSWKGGSGPDALRRGGVGSSDESEKVAGGRVVVGSCTAAVASGTFGKNMSRSPRRRAWDSETSRPPETGLDVSGDDDDEATAGENAASGKSRRPAYPEASKGAQNASEVQDVDGSCTSWLPATVLQSSSLSRSPLNHGHTFSTSRMEGEELSPSLQRSPQRETNQSQHSARLSKDLKDRHGTANERRGGGSGRGGVSGEAAGLGGGTRGRQKIFFSTGAASNSRAGTISAVADSVSGPRSRHSVVSTHASRDGEVEEEWKPSASRDLRPGVTSDLETWGTTSTASRPRTSGSSGSSNSKATTSLAGGTAVGSGCGAGLWEDLTVPDASQERCVDGRNVIADDGGWSSSRSKGASHGGESEVLSRTVDGDSSNGSAVVRGITLKKEHFDRILVHDGWLTSQIVDVRVKQLQEKHPQNLYFDSSFFGFLCPKTDEGGGFVVDNARVQGWTKSSRLPGGKESLFDMKKLFIPINQGNVHWVLVVVDLDCGKKPSDGGGVVGADGRGLGEGEGKADKVVWFFDSRGRDGTPYVEAIEEYLVGELSIWDPTRIRPFDKRPRPPDNAPRQQNNGDCGILMLHVMEKLSEGSVDQLVNLSQDKISDLRQDLLEIIGC